MRKRGRSGYWFVLPFIIGLVLFFIPAFVESICYGFSEIQPPSEGTGQYTMKFIGLGNYRQVLFVDPDFVREVVSSLGSLILSSVIIIIYSLLIATILNKNLRGKGIMRAFLFLPVVISTGIISRVDAANVLTSATGGVLTSGTETGGMFTSYDMLEAFKSMHIDFALLDVVLDAVENMYDIITRSGVQLLIFLAGLQTISTSIYESAKVEGATWWETLWKITFPMISPLILVNVVYTVIDSFTAAGNPVMDRIYSTIVTDVNFPIASVMSTLYFIVVTVVLLVAVLITSRLTFYENK